MLILKITACFFQLIVLQGLAAQVLDKKFLNLDNSIYLLPDSTKFRDAEIASELFMPHQFGLQLINGADTTINGYIEFENEYLFAHDWRVIETASSRSIPAYLNELPISVHPLDTLIIQFEIKELDRLSEGRFSMSFLPNEVFQKRSNQKDITQSFFLGIFSFLTLFNLILFFVTNWKIYIKYAAYIFSAVLYLTYYYGYLQDIIPSLVSISPNIISIAYSLIFVLYFWFLNDLGDYKHSVPKADFFLRVGMWYKSIHMLVELPMLLMGWTIITHPVYKYTILLFEIALMLLIIYHILKAKNFRGRVVIAGSLLLIIAAILAQLNTGIDRGYILECGILAELLVFSVGLGYISRRFYEEKNHTQKLYVKQLEENKQIQENIERELESKVLERTAELLAEKEKVEIKSHENQILLHEIHHRVKNNLQMISSMINMQTRRINSTQVRSTLEEANSRISAIGLVHEHLYSNMNLPQIDLRDYINELTTLIVQSFAKKRKINTAVQVEKRQIHMEEALPIGLIINELIINSIKHAQLKVEKTLEIRVIVELSENYFHIYFTDNGMIKKHPIQEGFGFTLIKTLLENPKDLKIDSDGNQLAIDVTIKTLGFDK